VCHKDSECNLASVLIVTLIYYTDLQFSPNVYFHSVPQTFTVFTEYGESLHLKITSSSSFEDYFISSYTLFFFFKIWIMINNENLYIYCMEWYMHITADGN